MRLLVSGSRRNPNTTGAFITSNFDDSVEYEILEFPDRFAELISRKVFRALYHFVPLSIVRRMDRIFLQQVERFKPDVVLIFKGMEISRWSLDKVRARGIRLVNYNFDHPFEHFSRGTGNRFVTEAIPAYDLHISYSSVIAQQLSDRYGVHTACIPFGYHLSDTQYDQVIAEERPEINRLCFVGNPDDNRIQVIGELIADGFDIDLYGFGWEKHLKPSEHIVIHPPRKANSYWQDPTEFWKVLRQYRVQLNFFRPHNEGSHNLRTFEVPAVGGILLTPASAEQQKFFEVDKEIFFYSDYASMREQARRLMQKSPEEIAAIRESARKRSVEEDYSYKRRTRDLLAVLNNLTSHK